MGELGPVALDEAPGADALRVDARLAREHAHDELLLGHLEREDAYPDALPVELRAAPDVRRDVEAERRFSHARSRRQDDEVTGLETAGETVEIDEAGGDAGDLLLPLV